MQELITLDKIKDMAVRLSKSTAKPEFLNELIKVQKSGKEKRYELAKEVATVDNIKSKNIPLDSEFRITTRSFEDPNLFETLNTNENSEAPKIYFEDDHGIFEYEGTVITIVEETSDKNENKEMLSPEKIQALIQEGIEDIGAFITTTEFHALLNELYSKPQNERFDFVINEILDKEKIRKRNIGVPKEMKIQRSHFDDERPTLFCVTKYIGGAYPWHKVTITFDNEFVETK